MSVPPSRTLRERPDLDQLKRQAKELLEAFRAGDAEPIAEVAARYRDANPSTFALHDAQLVLARSYGFDSWPKLKAFVDGVTVQRLAEAARAGDVAQVRAVLRVRPGLVHMDMSASNEHQALHYAVLHRRPEVVRVLMEHGADARKGIYPHRRATGALTIARERGYEEIVAIIEEEEQRRPQTTDGAISTITMPDGPLTVAVKENRPDVLASLLDSGLDPDERRRVEGLEEVELEWGMPLWHCAHLGRHEMAKMLLEHGADPNGSVYASGSPIFSAYGQKDQAMIELLRQYGGAIGVIPAGLYGERELAGQMLAGEVDARLHEGTFAGQTTAEQLLWGATCGAHPEIVRMALEQVDWPRDDRRWYAILEQPLRMWKYGKHEFNRSDSLACFALVLQRSDANVGGRLGRTILHDVVAFRERMTAEEAVAFATMLLDAGARLDVRDDLLASTPLGWACRWGHIELVKLFLERGADVVEPDAEKWATPRAWAEKMGHVDVRALLA